MGPTRLAFRMLISKPSHGDAPAQTERRPRAHGAHGLAHLGAHCSTHMGRNLNKHYMTIIQKAHAAHDNNTFFENTNDEDLPATGSDSHASGQQNISSSFASTATAPKLRNKLYYSRDGRSAMLSSVGTRSMCICRCNLAAFNQRQCTKHVWSNCLDAPLRVHASAPELSLHTTHLRLHNNSEKLDSPKAMDKSSSDII